MGLLQTDTSAPVTHIYTYTHIHTCAHTYTRVLTHIHTHIYTCTHTCRHIYTYMYVCMHTYIHVHTHICTITDSAASTKGPGGLIPLLSPCRDAVQGQAVPRQHHPCTGGCLMEPHDAQRVPRSHPHTDPTAAAQRSPGGGISSPAPGPRASQGSAWLSPAPPGRSGRTNKRSWKSPCVIKIMI